jgi:hypothetical protein
MEVADSTNKTETYSCLVTWIGRKVNMWSPLKRKGRYNGVRDRDRESERLTLGTLLCGKRKLFSQQQCQEWESD